jgi:putative copper resistance protein D
MPGMNKVLFNLHTALTAWQWGPFSIAVAIGLVAIAYWYLRADWRLASKGRRWPGHRTLSFMCGLIFVDLALQSPVSTFTGSYFQAHVIQHLLLMAVAPPLLAMGAPSTLLLQTAGRATKKRWLAVLRSRPFAVATHPVIVWFLYFGAMFAFFLTGLINFAMQHMAVMDAINLVFLMGGCFYWWPMVGLDPIVHWRMGYGARIANLAIGVPFESFLGIAIMSDHSPIASMYTVASTHAGGGLLWAATELSTFAGLVPLFVQWQRADQRAGARADARADARDAREARPDRRLVTTSTFDQRFRPLLQPGNSSWEAMWKAKAGFVPQSQGIKPNSPPLHPERELRPAKKSRPGK